MRKTTLGCVLSSAVLRRFRLWQYRDPGANCSDFVAAFLAAFTSLQPDDYPVGVITASDVLGKARAHARVSQLFEPCQPRDFALACQYVGRVFVHVGVVYQGKVWHTSGSTGTVVDSIQQFKQRGTQFWIHKKLI